MNTSHCPILRIYNLIFFGDEDLTHQSPTLAMRWLCKIEAGYRVDNWGESYFTRALENRALQRRVFLERDCLLKE